jgi:hypothetical protein
MTRTTMTPRTIQPVDMEILLKGRAKRQREQISRYEVGIALVCRKTRKVQGVSHGIP